MASQPAASKEMKEHTNQCDEREKRALASCSVQVVDIVGVLGEVRLGLFVYLSFRQEDGCRILVDVLFERGTQLADPETHKEGLGKQT